MFSHIMVGSNDLERSRRFYDAVLGTLGVDAATSGKGSSGRMRLSYRKDGSNFGITEPINGKSATFANGATIGFTCNSPEQVQRFYDAGVANGGTPIEEPPGLRTGPRGKLYLAYVRDPDGNKLCAVYRLE